MRTFHLWLVPTGDAYTRLARVISELSARYYGPRFEPHLTLLGRLKGEAEPVVERTKQLARELRPFAVRLEAPGCESEYFRCLFLSVAPSSSLRAAHRRAARMFDEPSASPFAPHVSLLYGRFPMSLKRAIIASLPSDLPQAFLASRLQLVRADSTNPRSWRVMDTLSL